ncbi:MAG TPA: ATP-dependent zinc protease [Pseudomonas sp.]|nr:ATP-dependent zinc protease [Pseudomonas sp.]
MAAALLGILTLPAAFAADPGAQPPQVYGWVEAGIIRPENVMVKIKMDTGALTSSMDAKDLEHFQKNGEDWVRFKVAVKDSKTGQLVSSTVERKVERNIKVRGAGGAERRPVVLMQICIGQRVYAEQFSLRDRGDMLYPVLIGRRTLEKLGPIDVSRTFTQKPSCAP